MRGRSMPINVPKHGKPMKTLAATFLAETREQSCIMARFPCAQHAAKAPICMTWTDIGI